ncbi:MAG: hypothetical protein GKR87_04440 [Kiritimatiellae bacterium]|nr:hypothetical protein [Kiritimatiellia bacterium]
MNLEQKETLRQRIQETITRCKEDIMRLEKSASPIAPDKALGRLTRMDSLNDQGISKAALSQNQDKFYKLEQALDLIDRPEFGDCATCRSPISIERLMVLPESTRCVNCASK